MRWLSACKCLESLTQDYTHAFLVIDGERFAAAGAQPEVFDAMAVRGKRVAARSLLKPEKTALAIIEIGRAFRVGAFQINQVSQTAFLMGLHTHLKSTIRSCFGSVKLI
jgi:hypothetical protein